MQVVSVDDIPTFERLHVVASMQPTHATSDMPWADGVPVYAALAGAHDVAGATAATH